MTEDWSGISAEWQRLLKLGTHPVAVKFCRTADQLATGTTPGAKISVCQMVKGAAHGGWQLACSPEHMGCFTAQMVLGFRAPSDGDVAHHIKQFVEETETAKRLVANKPKLATGWLAGILTGPLGGFEPDVVLFLVNGLQAMGLLQACSYLTEGENLTLLNGMSSAVCAYAIVVPFQSGRANLSVPCVGSRRYGALQDHELIFSLPAHLVTNALEHARRMERNKKWPIPITNGFLSPTIPINYVIKPV